ELPLKVAHVLAVAAVLLAAAALCGPVPASMDQNDRKIAWELGDPWQRSRTVQRLVAMGHDKVPLLLSLARDVPPHPNKLVLYEHFLRLSLDEAFGSLKPREAIPFLIRHIGIEELVPGNTWSKGPARIASDYPAAGALINMGPEASRAVIKAYPHLKE